MKKLVISSLFLTMISSSSLYAEEMNSVDENNSLSVEETAAVQDKPQEISNNDALKIEYFVGIDLSQRMNGDISYESNQGNATYDYESDIMYGIHAGALLNDVHRVSLQYRLKDAGADDYANSYYYTPDNISSHNIFAKYDYLFSLTNSLSLTVGAKLGYEIIDTQYSKLKDDWSGMTYGAQLGLEYRFTNWSLFGELNHDVHTGELSNTSYSPYKTEHLSLDNETYFTAGVTYHF